MRHHVVAALVVSAIAVTGPACSKSDANNPMTDTGSPDVGEDTKDLEVEPDVREDVTVDQGKMWPSCDVQYLFSGDTPFDTLSEYCLFGGDGPAHQPNVNVFRFEPAAVLYADESSKDRFLTVPPGTTIGFSDAGPWDFPDGTILVKTFYYPRDERDPDGERLLLETRLIVKQGDVWEPYIYVWNDEQTDATFDRLGKTVPVTRVLADGSESTINYRVPNKNQCKNCHGQDDLLVPLGPKTAQLNRDVERDGNTLSQLEWMETQGLFAAAVPDLQTLPALIDPFGSGDLDLRARSYFDANCAHCHNPLGAGGASGLDLSYTQQNPIEYGICKNPVAAGEGAGGRFYDIVPGAADESIIVFRMESIDPEIKMPELPTQTSDMRGVGLISEWINSLTPPGCP